MDVISTQAASGKVLKMTLSRQVRRKREITQKTDPGEGEGERRYRNSQRVETRRGRGSQRAHWCHARSK